MLVDAAMQCNIPVIPMLEALRGVDIIIVVDLSAETDLSTQLRCTQNYAAAHNLPFPEINYADINQICSVHRPASGQQSANYYLFPVDCKPDLLRGLGPLQADFTSTFNLTYTPEQIDLLSGLMYTACMQSANIIDQMLIEK